MRGGPGNKWDIGSSHIFEQQQHLQKMRRLGLEPPSSTGGSLLGPIGFVLLLVLFIVWVSHGSGGSGGDRLTPGTYPFELRIYGAFWITSLKVEPSNSVILSGTYQNETGKTVTVLCGSQPGVNITVSDGTSVDGTERTCDGHEGERVSVDPGQAVNEYFVFPPSEAFSSGAPIRFLWHGTQVSVDLPSSQSSS